MRARVHVHAARAHARDVKTHLSPRPSAARARDCAPMQKHTSPRSEGHSSSAAIAAPTPPPPMSSPKPHPQTPSPLPPSALRPSHAPLPHPAFSSPEKHQSPTRRLHGRHRQFVTPHCPRPQRQQTETCRHPHRPPLHLLPRLRLLPPLRRRLSSAQGAISR